MTAVFLTLLGLLLPTQLGLHLWPSWSYVYGLRVDYLSPTIYLTDLLLLVAFAINLKKLFLLSYRHLPLTLVFILFIILNIFFAQTPAVAFIAWLRILMFLNLANYISGQPANHLRCLLLGLSAGVIIVSILALAEFANQKSIDGLFYWFGERHFDITTPGIARISLSNIQDLRSKISLLRPYSSFGHPNALGGFCLAIFFLLIQLKNKKTLNLIAIPFSVLGVFLSFSKAAILTFIFLLVIKALRLKPKTTFLLATFVSLAVSLIPLFNTSLVFGRSLIDRNYLIIQSVEIFKHTPLFGVGLGNFISAQGSFGVGLQGAFIYLQPVHNIFLLLLSEIGIVGLLVVGWIINKLVIDSKLVISNFVFVLSAVLMTGSLDHYWLTLPQTRLLLAVVIGLLLNKKISSILTTSN